MLIATTVLVSVLKPSDPIRSQIRYIVSLPVSGSFKDFLHLPDRLDTRIVGYRYIDPGIQIHQRALAE